MLRVAENMHASRTRVLHVPIHVLAHISKRHYSHGVDQAMGCVRARAHVLPTFRGVDV